MSRVTRIVLASIVTLIVIIGIFTSVQGASLSAQQDRAGAHLVSGAMVNLDHQREASAAPAELQQIDSGKGHGCESDLRTSPDD